MRRTRLPLRAWRPWSVVLALVFAGCTPGQIWIVRDNFGKEFTCPAERTTIARRAELQGHYATGPAGQTWVLGCGENDSPPPDVAADAGRLALWNRQHEDMTAECRKNTSVWQAEGCEKRALYVCAVEHTTGEGYTICNHDERPAQAMR